MKRLLVLGFLLSLCSLYALIPNADAQEKSTDGWVAVFNGKDLDGWKISYGGKGNEKNSTWKVIDGMIVSDGEISHLFSPRDDYKNFEARAEIMISDKGNSGFYFHTKFGPGFPAGYEMQVNATHSDPVRTGSVYNHVKIYKQLHKPNEWFTYHLRVVKNAIKVTVNNELLYEYVDPANTYKTGHFAFQQHNLGSVVKIRKFEVKELK
jgi:Domain of Unknown Function (DUF1080)